jgi:hypothetical protein
MDEAFHNASWDVEKPVVAITRAFGRYPWIVSYED